jgi:hypothetical protein
MECLIEAKTPSLLLHELAHRWSIVSFHCNRRVRFAANSGHAATAPACPFCAMSARASNDDAVELYQLGCEYAQGFAFGEPMDADAAMRLLTEERLEAAS